jgi:hypothetical protein
MLLLLCIQFNHYCAQVKYCSAEQVSLMLCWCAACVANTTRLELCMLGCCGVKTPSNQQLATTSSMLQWPQFLCDQSSHPMGTQFERGCRNPCWSRCQFLVGNVFEVVPSDSGRLRHGACVCAGMQL